jgi:DNA-binding transcriptional MerR regulator
MATVTTELLSTGDVARILGVSVDSVRVMERLGRLKAMRTVSGQRIFDRREVERMRAKREGQR